MKAILDATGGGTVTGASIGKDTVDGIEIVVGSAGNDELELAVVGGTVEGGPGNDDLFGSTEGRDLRVLRLPRPGGPRGPRGGLQ